ncbi:MAG: hypothetical protein ABI946_06770 [Chthoniobacterales bacterium]
MTKQNRIHSITIPRPRRTAERGSSLIIVMLSMLVLGIVAARILELSLQKAQGPTQAISWRYALNGAEAGVQSARMALLTSATDPDTAWRGWSPSEASSWPKIQTFALAPSTRDTERPLNTDITVTVDLPANLNPAGSGSPYYRVRSTGTAQMPGTTRTGTDAINIALRQMKLAKNTANPTPQVSRTVETILQPTTPFTLALLANDKIEMKKGKTMITDSWNSLTSDPYNPQNYDVNKNGNGGSIATNSTGGKDGTDKVIRLEQVFINGGIYKGGGVVETKSNVIIAGDIVDGFNRETRPPLIPDTNGYTLQASISPGDAKGGIVFNASNTPGMANYSFPELHIHNKDDKITLKNPDKNRPAYINIYVPGKFKVHGSALIVTDPKVYVTLYVGKDATIEQKGGIGGFKLGTDRAEFLQIYGVVSAAEAASGKTKKRKFKIKGNLTASIYAPTYQFEMKPKSGGADFYGSLVGRKFKIEGEQRIHYDESLASIGPISGYSVTSWIEDWVPKGKLASP